VKQRTTAARGLIAGVAVTALAVLAGCGSSSGTSSTGGGGSGGGKPVHGGNLIIANNADAQSMNNIDTFDNNSIWIFEQIFQPLYTVTNNGKGTMP